MKLSSVYLLMTLMESQICLLIFSVDTNQNVHTDNKISENKHSAGKWLVLFYYNINFITCLKQMSIVW